MRAAVDAAVARGAGEADLVTDLFAVLDTDTLPRRPGMSFEDSITVLKHSIYVPPIGDDAHRADMDEAAAHGRKPPTWDAEDGGGGLDAATAELVSEERPDEQTTGFMTGMYGTQRQTVMLVDRDGNVTFIERALWDASGNPIERGEGDVYFRFKIDGWDDDETS